MSNEARPSNRAGFQFAGDAMNWTVIYRTRNGERVQEAFEAASRDALFKQLAAKGISAIRIDEATSGRKPLKTRKKPQGANPSRRIVVCAVLGVAVSLGAFLAVKHLGGDSGATGRRAAQPTASRIAEAKPAIPTLPQTNIVESVVEKEDRNSLEWLKKHDKRYIVPEDAVRRPNGRLYTKDGRRILERLPARTIHADAGRKRVFEHQAEREIARLLSIEPGKFFIGNANYGARFQQSFAESVASPTPILEDDDAETIALKKEVNEVKADLAQRLKDGEDIVQIMKDTEHELRTLATFRNDMMKELTALRFDERVTEQDYRDYVEAANRMLKERGLRELSSPVFAEAQLKYIREVHKAKQAAKEAREASKQQSN